MVPALVVPYLLLIGLAAWGTRASYSLRQRFGSPFFKLYSTFILLSSAYALVNFVGEVFVPSVFPGPAAALVSAYMIIDLITIPLLGFIFYVLYAWIMRLLDRRTALRSRAAFAGIEILFLAMFVVSFTSYFDRGISSLTTAAVLVLNGIVLALLAASILILVFVAPAAADRRRLARGLGLVNGASLAVLLVAVAASRASVIQDEPVGRILPAGLTFLINFPGLIFLRKTVPTVPSLQAASPAADIAPTEIIVGLGLTDREGEIIRLVAEGLDNRGIGKRLYLSPKTVKNHITSIYAKTGVRNRVQLANLVRRRGNGFGYRP